MVVEGMNKVPLQLLRQTLDGSHSHQALCNLGIAGTQCMKLGMLDAKKICQLRHTSSQDIGASSEAPSTVMGLRMEITKICQALGFKSSVMNFNT